jgi:hypothetical protein
VKQVIIVITILLLVSNISVGCAQPTQPKVPRSISGLLGGAGMAPSVDATTLEPSKIIDVFKKDIPIIYCSVLLMDAPKNTIIQARMFIIKGEGGEENLSLHGSNIEADGTRFLSFAWKRPGNVWPTGDYKVVVSVNGKEDITVLFSIR